MEVSRFKASDWLKIGGAAVFLIAGFLTWWSVHVAGFGSVSSNVFDFFFTGIIPWVLFIVIGVLSFLIAAEIYKPPSHIPAPLVLLGASALALLLVIIRFFSDGVRNDLLDAAGADTSRGAGLFLALLGGIAVVAGCVLGFKEAGGDLSDLKDIDKLRSAFNKGPDTPGSPGTPPPPPPTGGPPSPPPPGR